MADAQGIRRRVGKGDIAYAGISPLPSSSRSAGPDAANATEEPDGNDEYGYAGSEHSADERLATESAEGSQNGEEFGEGENDELLQRDLGEGEDDGEGDYTEGSSADEDSDNDGARPLPSFPDHPPEDDTLVLIAGAVGFLLAMVCSALLVSDRCSEPPQHPERCAAYKLTIALPAVTAPHTCFHIVCAAYLWD